MKSNNEIKDALEARVKQLNDGLDILNTHNGPFISRTIYESVKEELETFLGWMIK